MHTVYLFKTGEGPIPFEGWALFVFQPGLLD